CLADPAGLECHRGFLVRLAGGEPARIRWALVPVVASRRGARMQDGRGHGPRARRSRLLRSADAGADVLLAEYVDALALVGVLADDVAGAGADGAADQRPAERARGDAADRRADGAAHDRALALRCRKTAR